MPDPSPETQQLRAALEAANRRERDAVERATAFETRLRAETGNRFSAEEAAIDASIREHEAQQTAFERQIETLHAEGKFAEAAAAMRKMTEVSAATVNLRNRKEWLAQQKTAAAAPPQQSADPYAGYSEAQRRWISENPRYASDPQFAARVNAAAGFATNVEGIAADSPEFFERLERAAYPERFQQAQQQNDGQGTDGAAPTGDPGDGAPSGATEGPEVVIERDRHTLPAQQSTNRATDPPAMRIEMGGQDGAPAEPVRQTQYQPAVGRGNPGDAMRSVAAPPSRNIAAAAQRAARGRAIEPTQAEVDMAVQLAHDLEPDSEMVRSGNTREMVQWYAALAQAATSPKTRRGRTWARDALVG